MRQSRPNPRSCRAKSRHASPAPTYLDFARYERIEGADLNAKAPALLGVGLILFTLLLGGAVTALGTPALDGRILLALAPLRDGNGADFWRVFTWLGDKEVRIVVGFAAAGWLSFARRPRLSLILLTAVGLETLANAGLKLLFARQRPDLLAHLDSVTSLAYPSGHSAHSAALYLLAGLTIAATLRTPAARTLLVACAILVALLIGVSRTVLGVHWPTDVIGGLAFGAGCALLAWSISAASACPRASSWRG